MLLAQRGGARGPGESSGEQMLSGQEEQEPVALPEFLTRIPQAVTAATHHIRQ